MNFLEQRLDTRITHGAKGGPTVPGRSKFYLPNGRLRQKFAASMPIHKYDVSHGLRSRADFQILLDLFYVVMFTPYEGFRFKDWRDFIATQANSRCTLISGSNYQLQRVHTFGAATFLRDIKKPVSGTVTVFRTRGGVVSAAAAIIDYTTGIAAVSGHVAGDTYTWTGEFDVPVTFTDDAWMADLEVSTQNLHVTSSSIVLEEIRS
jgi:uncharacterized protein (TIGR02217 family)